MLDWYASRRPDRHHQGESDASDKTQRRCSAVTTAHDHHCHYMGIKPFFIASAMEAKLVIIAIMMKAKAFFTVRTVMIIGGHC